MVMSENEQCQLRELEAQLAGQRKLAALARRLESASVDTGQRRLSVLLAVGGSIGLMLVAVAAAVHSSALGAVGVAGLAGTMLLVGAAGIVVEAAGDRRGHRLPHSRPPRSPSR